MKKIIKSHGLIIFLLLIGILLRFHKLTELFFFNIDEEWYNFIIRRIIVLGRPVLIGWEIPGGILVPPVMYYFGSFVMLIFRNNPLGFAATASLFGVIGIFLVYKVGQKIFKNELIALLSSLIYCFSYLVNIYNRLSINLLFAPILSLLAYLSLYSLIKTNNRKWLFVIALILVFATQEGSMLSLFLLILLTILIFKPKIKPVDYLYPSLLFLSCLVPVVIFELRHNFLGINKLIGFLSFSGVTHGLGKTVLVKYFGLMFRSFSRMLVPSGPSNINIQILPCSEYLQAIGSASPLVYPIAGLVCVLSFMMISLIQKDVGKKIISLHFLSIGIGLSIYSVLKPGYLYEWFFVILFPAFCFITAFLLVSLAKIRYGFWGLVVFLLLFIPVNLQANIKNTAVVGYKDKLNVVKAVARYVGKNNFDLEMIGNGCNGYGYRYLLTYIGTEPVKSYTDQQDVGWLYPENKSKPEIEVILVPLADIDSQELKSRYVEAKNKAEEIKRIGNVDILFVR